MISFHPTISPLKLLRAVFSPCDEAELARELTRLFPNHAITLTDSGRSALSLAIEALGLEGKTLILPAYICDVLLPILTHHTITPIFLDIDERTFQPPKSAYTSDVLEKADAVLLVATYGKLPSHDIIEHFKDRGITIIEDHAHRDPRAGAPLEGDARIYSLPKAFAVPDGGLLVLQDASNSRELPPKRFSLSYVKNVLKLFPFVGPLLATIRRGTGASGFTHTSWHAPTKPSKLTKKLLCHALQGDSQSHSPELYYPLRTSHPRTLFRTLARSGISTERLWHQPLIMHPKAEQLFGFAIENYPNTKKVASEIVCAPLWHIKQRKEHDRYVERLEKALAQSSGE